ncbi:MAG: hypothetical protein ACR65O_06920 [Methylomicrobium sp.]
MTLHCPPYQSERNLTRDLIKPSGLFVGVVGGTARGANHAQRHVPIRLRFDTSRLHLPLIDGNSLQHLGVDPDEIRQHDSQNGVITASRPCSSELCPLAGGGDCNPYGYLNVTLGGEPLGCFVFRIPSVTHLHTLFPRRRYIESISGKRRDSLPLELRLRDKSLLQHHGTGIYYVDLILRSGTTLEKTLANARGTASRWFRYDRATD